MALAICEADDFVLDRRAIARAAPRYRAGIDGGAMRIRADDAMGLGGGAGDVARALRRSDGRRQRGKELGLCVAVLDFEPLPIDRQAVESWRSSGFQPRKVEARRVETSRERHGRLIAEAPGRRAVVAEMDYAAKECAGGDDDGSTGERAAVGELDPCDGARLGRDSRAASPSTSVRFGVFARSSCIARR